MPGVNDGTTGVFGIRNKKNKKI